MSRHHRKFIKETKDYGELLMGSGQVWFDFQPANEATEQLVLRFLDEIGLSYPTKGGRRKLVLAMSDVIMAARHAPSRLIIWPMDTSYFTGAPYGADFARLVRNSLIDAGYLREVQKSSKWDKLARLYRVRLPHYVTDCSFKPHGIGPVVEVRSRRRRDNKGRQVGARRLSLKKFDVYQMIDITSRVKAINALMAEHPLVHPNGQTFMRCRRIFNEGSLEKGGRYYGGWQNYSEEDRLTMTIGGAAVAEIDLKACFLVVLGHAYNKGRPSKYQVQLPFDPYSTLPFVRECNDPDRRKRMRDLAKLLVSSVLANKGDLNKLPKGKKKVEGQTTGKKRTISVRDEYALGKDIKASDLYGQIHATFPFIKWMDARVFDLMYLESEIIGQTMHRLATTAGIPTYPVHDCLMCRVDDVERVLDELVATSNALLGAPISLDVSYPDRPTQYFKAEGSTLVRCDQGGVVLGPRSPSVLPDNSQLVVIENH